jgi:methyltransferase
MPFRSPETYLVLLALVAAQRLLEMRTSRRNCAALGPGAQSPDPPGNWPAMVVFHALLLVLPALEVLWTQRVAPAPLFWAGLVALGAAQLLRFWALRTLGPMWNARGLIHPDQQIVSSGPYQYIKHPNYLAVLVELVAIPVIGGAWRSLGLLLLPHLVILWRRIKGEEALLRETGSWSHDMAGKAAFYPKRAANEARTD